MEIKIPDYDEMIAVTNEIAKLMHEKDTLKNQIDFCEGLVLRTVNLDSKYYVNGKPPATNFVETAYFNMKFEDMDEVDFPKLKAQLASVSSELEKYKMVFDVMKQQILLFQIDSANKRNSLV